VRVCGTIFSEDGKRHYQGKHSFIRKYKSAIATTTGYFNLENVPLNATLTISYIGYEDQQFSAKELFSNNKICTTII
jgi:hypothetical protein